MSEHDTAIAVPAGTHCTAAPNAMQQMRTKPEAGPTRNSEIRIRIVRRFDLTTACTGHDPRGRKALRPAHDVDLHHPLCGFDDMWKCIQVARHLYYHNGVQCDIDDTHER